jgi:pyridoxal phosphate enzyme (YggS family)
VAIADQLAEVRNRIAEAAHRSGRAASDVTLVAVSKTFGVDRIREAWDAGQRDFGENKVQEGLQKVGDTADIAIRWHLIGHLQSNKAKKAAAAFAWIQSVDSLDLLQRLDAAAVQAGRQVDVLVQVDLAGEATKFGAAPDEAERIVRAAVGMDGVTVSGLMLIPPWSEDPERTRPWFVRIREFRDRLLQSGVPSPVLRHLSMGMSHDYEAAVEEGSTIVRVGTAIFGKRPPVSPVSQQARI